VTGRSKRTGLEKAIYQVEQAIKRSKDAGATLGVDAENHLRHLINESQVVASTPMLRKDSSTTTSHVGEQAPFAQQVPFPGGDHNHATVERGIEPVVVGEQSEKPDELALNNADNPLQLLAMASILPGQSPSTAMSTSPAAGPSQPGSGEVNSADAELQRFFGSLLPNLDNSPEIDPVEMGLATMDEAESLFSLYVVSLEVTAAC